MGHIGDESQMTNIKEIKSNLLNMPLVVQIAWALTGTKHPTKKNTFCTYLVYINKKDL